MNPHDDERLPGEDELAALYRKLPDKQPGPALDAAVLRAAAEAIRPAVAQPRRRPRWPVALGTAATLILAFGLTWRMREWPSATQPAPLPAPASAEHDESASPASAVTVATTSAPAPTALPAPIAPPAVAAPRRANPGLDARSEKHTSAPPRIAANRQRAPAPPPPAPPAPPAPIAEATVAAAAPAAEPAAPEADAAMPAGRELARATAKPAAQVFAAPAPAPFVDQPVSTQAQLQSNRDRSAPGVLPEQQAAQEQAYAAPAPAPAYAPAPIAPAPVGAAAKSAGPDPTAAQAGDTPAQELDKIRRLLALDRRDEARQRLATFHRDHPDYALPPDLRAQLPTP